MSTDNMNNPFGQINNIINNPIAQVGIESASSYLNMKKIQVSGLSGKIFNEEIRSYFNVSTILVRNKLIKLLFPFRQYEFEYKIYQLSDEIKKLQLYIPIVSLMTLILFSTLLRGILQEEFHPNFSRKTIWILLVTLIQVGLAKCTENAIANLNISFIQLASLVNYRFVSLSVVTIILVITNMSIPYLRFIGIIYVLIVDTYYCKLELSNFSKQKFKDQGLGNQIALLFHFFTTLSIIWLSDLLV